MQAVKDAYENTLEKEIALERIREEQHLLNMEFTRANDKRDNTVREKLEAELEVAAGELKGFEDTYNTLKADKDKYDEEEKKLMDERAAMDTDGSD